MKRIWCLILLLAVLKASVGMCSGTGVDCCTADVVETCDAVCLEELADEADNGQDEPVEQGCEDCSCICTTSLVFIPQFPTVKYFSHKAVSTPFALLSVHGIEWKETAWEPPKHS